MPKIYHNTLSLRIVLLFTFLPVFPATTDGVGVTDISGSKLIGDPQNSGKYGGHGVMIADVDGKDWTSYLLMIKEGNGTGSEKMGIDPIRFENGKVITTAASFTEQVIIL